MIVKGLSNPNNLMILWFILSRISDLHLQALKDLASYHKSISWQHLQNQNIQLQTQCPKMQEPWVFTHSSSHGHVSFCASWHIVYTVLWKKQILCTPKVKILPLRYNCEIPPSCLEYYDNECFTFSHATAMSVNKRTEEINRDEVKGGFEPQAVSKVWNRVLNGEFQHLLTVHHTFQVLNGDFKNP